MPHMPSPDPLGHYRGIGGQQGYCFIIHTHIHTHALGPPSVQACEADLLLVRSSRFRPFNSHCMSKHIYSLKKLVSVNGRQEQQTALKLACNFSSKNTFHLFFFLVLLPEEAFVCLKK